MVKQTAISVKLDTDQLDKLNVLCSQIGCNRNKFINFAVKVALDNMFCYQKSLLTSVYQTIII